MRKTVAQIEHEVESRWTNEIKRLKDELAALQTAYSWSEHERIRMSREAIAFVNKLAIFRIAAENAGIFEEYVRPMREKCEHRLIAMDRQHQEQVRTLAHDHETALRDNDKLRRDVNNLTDMLESKNSKRKRRPR